MSGTTKRTLDEMDRLHARVAELEAEAAHDDKVIDAREKEITSLRARVVELEGMLRPFAALADQAERMGQQSDSILYVTLGLCRRARVVLNEARKQNANEKADDRPGDARS